MVEVRQQGGEPQGATSRIQLFALEEALGEAGWLKATGLEGYAPRSRGEPEALQGVLFSYLEAL